MKVLLFGAHPIVCGASFSMLKLMEELNSLGVDVVPVVRKGFLNSILEKKNINRYIVNQWSWLVSNDYSWFKELVIKRVKKFLNFFSLIRLVQIIKKENPDVVHVNVLTSYLPVVAALKCNKPIVWHIREMVEEDLNGHFWNKNDAYALMRKADYFVAISECVRSKYAKIVGENKIKCVYNGIDVEDFYRPKHQIFTEKKIRVTLAGRICKSKGQLPCLIELAPILKANTNIILQFAGVGNELEVQKIVECRNKLHLNENQVLLLGHVNKMADLWETTDIAIVYSKYEAFGRVTIEAKMAGALVLGYNSGGTIELIENGCDGFLFGNGLPSLNCVFEKVISNSNESSRIANLGRERAIAKFTSKKNAEQVLDIYKEVLDNRRYA